ncbi:MAG: insulinase family protein [Chloracidobacterium sp.]|nr:insulinase family protein [Chloracidobacterium sp.]
MERLGAGIGASASDDFTIVSASSLSLYSSDILSLLAEVVLRPTFPENELDLYRRNTIENLKFQRSQPGFLANEQAARLIYGTHPYAVVSPTRRTSRNLTVKRSLSFTPKSLSRITRCSSSLVMSSGMSLLRS